MRRFFLGAIAISILLVLTGIGTTAALAGSGSLQPGDALFPLQYFAEQSQGKLITTDIAAAKHFISIAGRRAVDLGSIAGTSDELLSIYYLDQALDQAAVAVAKTERTEIEVFRLDLVDLLLQIRDSASKLSVVPIEDPDVYNGFIAKIESLQNLIVNPNSVSSDFASIVNINSFGGMANVDVPKFVEKNNTDNLISGGPQSIPFPENSPGAQHDFFPLIGEHATIDCESCHTTSQYVGTADTCEACHTNIKPVNHYQGDCAACHTPISWHSVSFDHVLVGATDCQACHANNKPANHFGGQCSACHNTSAWLPASFSHSGQTDCQACHSNNKPANHFGGQCSACHNTSAWLPASFSHSGQTDCQACHGRPAGHYAGQCSQCHTTSTWTGAAVHFAGADCQACHSRPSGHYGGQCSQCHSTSTWSGANYHFVGANCVACHRGHTTQQCSNCHNTSDWDDADDDDHDGGGHDDDDDDD